MKAELAAQCELPPAEVPGNTRIKPWAKAAIRNASNVTSVAARIPLQHAMHLGPGLPE